MYNDKITKSLAEAAMQVMVNEKYVERDGKMVPVNQEPHPETALTRLIKNVKDDFAKDAHDRKVQRIAKQPANPRLQNINSKLGKVKTGTIGTGGDNDKDAVGSFQDAAGVSTTDKNRGTVGPRTMKQVRDISGKDGKNAKLNYRQYAASGEDKKDQQFYAGNEDQMKMIAKQDKDIETLSQQKNAKPAKAAAPNENKPFVKKYKSQMQSGLSNEYTASKKSDADMIKRQDKDIVALSKQKDAPGSSTKAAPVAAAPAASAAAPAASAAAPAAKSEVQRPGDTRSDAQRDRLEKWKKEKEIRDKRVSHEPASEPGSEDNAQYKETEPTPKKGFLDKVKDFGAGLKKKAEGLPGYNERTGEQTYFGKGKEVEDEEEDGTKTTRYVKKENVGKRDNTNILGMPENYTLTFAGSVAALVESSYTIKNADKESIIENIQDNFGDFFTEAKSGKSGKAKNPSSKSYTGATGAKKLPSNKDLGIPEKEKPSSSKSYTGAKKLPSNKDLGIPDDDDEMEKQLDKRYITSKDDEEPSIPSNVKHARTMDDEGAEEQYPRWTKTAMDEEVDLDEGKLDDYLDRKRLEKDFTEPWDNPKKVKKTIKSLVQYSKRKRSADSSDKK